MNGLDKLLLEDGLGRLKVLRMWRQLAPLIAREITKRLPGARVYVFGSVLENNVTGGSDLDLMVVLPYDPPPARRRAIIVEEVEENLGLPPGILHVVFVKEGSEDELWFLETLKVKRQLVYPKAGEGE